MFVSRIPFDTPENPLITLLHEKKSRGEVIFDLTESNPTKAGLSYPQAQIIAALSNKDVLKYQPSAQGMKEAREAIARYYAEIGCEIDPEYLFITASTSEAYSYLFKLLTAPGDDVLIPAPSYPLFEMLAGFESVHSVSYPLKYNDRCWHIDPKAVNDTVSNNTRAVIVISPNNPTGSYLKQHELNDLNRVCSDHDCALIVDEVFLDYTSRCFKHDIISACKYKDVLTFVLNGFSKILALPQLKLSWIYINGPEQLRKEARRRLEFIADTYLSVSAPVQVGAAKLLEQRQVIQTSVIERIECNDKILRGVCSAADGFRVLVREGGWYAMVEVDRADIQWAYAFLKKLNVFVHPGYFYNASPSSIVLSLLPQPAVFHEAINRLVAFMH